MHRAAARADYPITAFAAANGLGMDTAAVRDALRAGRCRLDIPFETACGALPDELPPPPAGLRAYDTRLCRMALHTLDGIGAEVRSAVRRLGAGRVAIAIGTSTGGIRESELAYDEWARLGRLPASFDFDRQHTFHALLEVVRTVTGADGPAWIISTA